MTEKIFLVKQAKDTWCNICGNVFDLDTTFSKGCAELTKEVEFKIYNKIRKKYPNLNRQELSLVVELVFEELKKLERI